MTPAGTSNGRDPEGPQNEASNERAPAAHPTVHEDVLIFLQLGPVVLDVP